MDYYIEEHHDGRSYLVCEELTSGRIEAPIAALDPDHRDLHADNDAEIPEFEFDEKRVELTQKQSDLLEYIRTYRSRNGDISPTLEEMAGHFRLTNEAIYSRLSGLMKKGAIRRTKHKSRSYVPII